MHTTHRFPDLAFFAGTDLVMRSPATAGFPILFRLGNEAGSLSTNELDP
jgi:hypothetical protein